MRVRLTRWTHGAAPPARAWQLGLCVWGAAIAALGVLAFAPGAAGSGVPDVIAYLNGLAMASAVSPRTLLVCA